MEQYSVEMKALKFLTFSPRVRPARAWWGGGLGGQGPEWAGHSLSTQSQQAGLSQRDKPWGEETGLAWGDRGKNRVNSIRKKVTGIQTRPHALR